MTHQVLSNDGEFSFRLLGKCMIWLVCVLLVHLPTFDFDMLTCCYVLACSVSHHVNEAFAPDQLKLLLASYRHCYQLSMSPLIIMFVALSIEVLVRSRSGNHIGSTICCTLRLPHASEVLVFTSLAKLTHMFQVDSMATYAQPKYSNPLTFDALNCGTLCFQVS